MSGRGDQHADPGSGRELGIGLWRVILGPSVWAVHFVVIYVLAAIHCEKAGRAAVLAPLWPQVLALTALALMVIGYSAWRLAQIAAEARRDSLGTLSGPQARLQFLSKLGLMLAALAAGAVCFTIWPVLALEICR